MQHKYVFINLWSTFSRWVWFRAFGRVKIHEFQDNVAFLDQVVAVPPSPWIPWQLCACYTLSMILLTHNPPGTSLYFRQCILSFFGLAAPQKSGNYKPVSFCLPGQSDWGTFYKTASSVNFFSFFRLFVSLFFIGRSPHLISLWFLHFPL